MIPQCLSELVEDIIVAFRLPYKGVKDSQISTKPKFITPEAMVGKLTATAENNLFYAQFYFI